MSRPITYDAARACVNYAGRGAILNRAAAWTPAPPDFELKSGPDGVAR
ncbi:MAG: hypothetical protein ACYC5F_06765 [Thermoleophilia bacterium]